jgi:hypothetical protein
VLFELPLDLADRAERLFERRALLHRTLRLGGIVPEIRIFGLLVQFGEACLRRFDVKDASSAVRPTA